jgi:hypothetical protein
MFNYLKDIGVDFLSESKPIMLGYDYGCLNGIDNCEKIYHSFNRKEYQFLFTYYQKFGRYY